MNYIATWSFEPFKKNARHEQAYFHLKNECIVFATLASLSIESFSRVFNCIPTVYTDSIGEEVFAHLPCNTINIYDKVFDNMSPRMWAYPKILTYEQQINPYLHFDLDFFLIRGFDPFAADVVTQAVDNCEATFTTDPRSFGMEVPDVMYEYLAPSATVGVLAMNNMKLNAEYASIAKDYMQRNQHLDLPTERLNCVLEQQLLTALMKKDDYTMAYMNDEYKSGSSPGYYHFSGYSKLDYHIRDFLRSKVTTDHRLMAKKIYECIK